MKTTFLNKVSVMSKAALLTVLSSSFSNVYADSSTTLGNRIDLTLNSEGGLTVDSSYLTYYILRGIDSDNNLHGMHLIERSPKRVDFDVAQITDWNGILPVAVEFKGPTFYSTETQIDLSKESYDWRNSQLRVTGASLKDIFVKRPLAKDSTEAVDRLVVVLMNAVALADVLTETVSATTGLENNSFNQLKEKIAPLAKKIVNIKDTLEDSQILLDFADIMVDQTELLITESGIDIEDYPNVKFMLDFYQDISTTVRKMMNAAGVIENNSIVNKGTIKAQFEKSLKLGLDDGTVALLEQSADFSKAYAEYMQTELGGASERTQQVVKINKLLLEPIGKTLELVINVQKQALKNATSTEDKNKIQAKIDTLRNGYALIKLASFIDLLNDDFLTTATEHPEVIVPMLLDLGKVTAIAIFEAEGVDNVDNWAKGITQAWAKGITQTIAKTDGRAGIYRKIGKGSKYMAAFQTGAVAGNVVIPFIWDAVLGESFYVADITNSQLSRLGVAETEVAVTSAYGEKSYYHNDSTQSLNGQQPIYLAAEVGKPITFTPSMKWSEAFSEDRAPWVGNLFLPSLGLYDYTFASDNSSGTTLYNITRFCVRKSLLDLEFSIVKQYGGTSIAAIQCNDSSAYDTNMLSTINGTVWVDKKYEHQSQIDEKYLLNKFVSEGSESPMNNVFTLSSQEPEVVQMSFMTYDYDSKESRNFHYVFRVVAKNVNLATTVSLDAGDASQKTVTASINLSDEEKNSGDGVEKLVWDWGDGQTTTIDITSDAIYQPYSHQYVNAGQYTVTAKLYRQSGQIATGEQTITVGDVEQPASPTNITLSNTSVAENDAGAVIGTLTTTDPNSGDTHTYSVSDSRFEVSGNQLKLKAGQALDYEAETSVTLTVTSTDSGSLTFNKDFTLTVTDDVSDNTSTVTAIPTKLNDTGITACGTADSTSNSADCSTAVSNASGSQVPLGQDGHYGTGRDGSKGMVFSKVAGYEDKCVQDEHTGLMWEVKQTSGLHSTDNTYSWYSTTNNGGNDGTQNGGTCTGSDCDTAVFVNAVNAAGWCGYHDWRLPTRRELRSIVDYSRYDPAIDTAYFPQTMNDFYWSSSPYAGYTDYAWGVGFNNGLDHGNYKDDDGYVRLVRGGQ